MDSLLTPGIESSGKKLMKKGKPKSSKDFENVLIDTRVNVPCKKVTDLSKKVQKGISENIYSVIMLIRIKVCL